ncbi:PREDICTED: feruloyl CoA ortho-hydroxylase 1-like [Ipomoea nil]|uniref:feruloyl CoA ortho-hydroxylase 1-like n=1 Tax=Ipomoea nil TaxID=35883 RepID=UPI0009018ADD|nr:PREDICTED: feruloyl CoA ortho-hydroxylase 1-like [Ipomoea nil]
MSSTLCSVLSNLTAFVVNDGHGVKGLSDLGLEALPEQYIQPPSERITASTVIADASIPVIDMSSDNPEVGEMICEAAKKWGFFQIINHGIPLQVLEEVMAATYRFFRQPAEEKKKHSKENSPTTNVRYGTSFAPHAEKALEWKDYLSLFYVSDEQANSLWPSACREEALNFLKITEIIVRRLLEALMGGLNVKEMTAAKESLLMGSRRININYYPKCPNPDLTVGIGRHSDVSTLTLLLQDQIGGLYVRKLDGGGDAWVAVPPITGALVINIGDALQILSNGRYKSIEHRVMANGSNSRISVPIFVNPRPEDVIGPLPEVLDGGEKPLYKQVLYSDYVRHFYKKAHDGKETVDFAKLNV